VDLACRQLGPERLVARFSPARFNGFSYSARRSPRGPRRSAVYQQGTVSEPVRALARLPASGVVSRNDGGHQHSLFGHRDARFCLPATRAGIPGADGSVREPLKALA
jgi:hypothetical protein